MVASAVIASFVVLIVVIPIKWLPILPLFVMVALRFCVVGWFSIFSHMDVTGTVENFFQVNWVEISSSATTWLVTSVRVCD